MIDRVGSVRVEYIKQVESAWAREVSIGRMGRMGRVLHSTCSEGIDGSGEFPLPAGHAGKRLPSAIRVVTWALAAGGVCRRALVASASMCQEIKATRVMALVCSHQHHRCCWTLDYPRAISGHSRAEKQASVGL